MENRKFVGSIIALGVLMSTPSVAYGYAVSTHASLTEKTFAEYERVFGDTFTDEEIERAKQGSREEDTFESKRRPLNHFYDPVNDIGLRAHGMLSIPNITSGLAAPVWAVDTEAQANFLEERIGYTDTLFSSPTDFSWDRAVYEYVHGDKERAVKTLGHIIHLVQDATSPAHVRNDAHLMGDVYETFTAGKQPGDWHIAESDMLQDNSIQSIIQRTALFTNENFLSGDTIFEYYENPNEQEIDKWESIDLEEETRLFGYNKHGALVSVVSDYNFLGQKIDETYTLLDPYNIVLNDYWETLSKRAVRDGVAAIKLFFQDVETERETLALHDKNKSAAEERFESAQATLFGIAKSLYGSSVDEETFEELNPDAAEQGASVVAADASNDPEEAEVLEEQGADAQDIEEQSEGEERNETGEVRTERDEEGETDERDNTVSSDGGPAENNTDDTNTESSDSSGPFGEDIPIQGVGGGGSSSQEGSSEDAAQEESEPEEEEGQSGENDVGNDQEGQSEKDEAEETENNEEENQDSEKEEKDTTPPNAPIINTPNNPSHTFTDTQITFTGTAEATTTIHTDVSDATTSVSTNGEWSFTLSGFPQGTSTLKFFAVDNMGNMSKPATTTISVDSEIAAPTLSITECGQSLSQTGCVVATTTLSVQWDSTDNDLSQFIVDQGNGPATTTATSTRITTDDLDDISISVRAVDTAGNTSNPVSKNVSVRSNPVVINEVAWMGTRASAFDEWIELYNPTDTDISLEGWTLYADDGSPYIPLSGSIDAGGYYLIERTDDQTLASTTADLAVPFSGIDGGAGLSNSGQRLVLARHNNTNATTTVDKTPNCGSWCGGGDKNTHRTMERYDVHTPGTDRDNWGTVLSAFIRNGIDADGGNVNGTPGERNSISYQITNGHTLKEDKTLTAEHPYIIGRDGFTVEEDVTLTLEKGVVVKFVSANEPSLIVDGALKANGTETDPVVFTAFADDTYGGDMNDDGKTSTPTPGSWKKIRFTDASERSSLTHTIIRYGGRWFRNTDMKAAVAVDHTNVSFDQVTISHPDRHGLYLRTSTSTITNSTFKYGTPTSDAAGVYVAGGAPRISDSLFTKNEYGTYIADAPSAEMTDNTFMENETAAVHVHGPVPHTSGNEGLGNALNAITVGHNGDIAEPHSTTTLQVNDLPYVVVGESEVPADATLAFESGVMIKAHDDSGNDLGTITVKDGGRMVHDGIDPDDVVFTSMHDDAIGGVVHESMRSPEPGDWEGVVVENGGYFSMRGFTLRYAGHERGRSPADGLRIETESGTTTVAHAVIEHNKQFGILAREDTMLNISDTEIQDHPKDSDVARNRIGLLLLGSDAVLSDVVFTNNELDIEAAKGATVECSECGSPSTDPPDLLGE